MLLSLRFPGAGFGKDMVTDMEFDLTKPYCRYFNEICSIPHGSGNEKALSDRLAAFATECGLGYMQDALWNVVIYKPASAGYEDHPGVVIQAHMDMVCEKTPESDHDFEKDPLALYTQGDHLRARGTTLGADDGMGCAYMLAILADDTLMHPYLECCFTTQEETGLVGAQALKPEYFKARRLINLDGAGEYKTYMGMGGGEQVTLIKPVTWEDNDKPAYRLCVSGLLGGHSGGMIDKERANAAKLAARVLCRMEQEGIRFQLAGFAGGTKHNVIMPEAEALFVTDENPEQIQRIVECAAHEIAAEYEQSDPDIRICVKPAEPAQRRLTERDSEDLIHLLYLLPNGLLARSPAVEGEPPVTSANTGVVRLDESEAEIVISARSGLECALEELKRQVTLLGELYGAAASYSGYYPGWKYEAESELRETMKQVFESIYHKPLACLIGHGGNECGVFKKMFPEMEIVTSGAIYGNIHTTEEFLDLASFDRSWTLLTRFLEAL